MLSTAFSWPQLHFQAFNLSTSLSLSHISDHRDFLLNILFYFSLYHTFLFIWPNLLFSLATLLAGAVEYTDCTSAKGYDPPNMCPRYHIKPYDGENPVLELWGMLSIPSLLLLPGLLLLWVVVIHKAFCLDVALGHMNGGTQWDLNFALGSSTFKFPIYG